jgi:hypothetical protein
VGVAADPERDRGAEGALLVADFDVGEVEGVEDQLDPAADQQRVDLVGVGMQRDRGVGGDGAVLGPQERLAELGGGGPGQRVGQALLPTPERRRAGLGMDLGVVVGLHPGDQQAVQLGQVADPLGVAVQLDQELAADGAEEPLDLAASLRPARGGVHQLDAKAGAGSQQPGVYKRRAVVDVDLLGDAAGGQRGPKRCRQPHGVLVVAEPGGHHRPGPVIDEAEQDGLAPGDDRAVQRIPGPQLVGPVGFEPAEHRRAGLEGAVKLQAHEVALQGALRRRPARLGPQDPCDLRGGALGVLPLERRGHLKHLGRGPRGHPCRGGHQGFEPAGAPPAHPPVDRLA